MNTDIANLLQTITVAMDEERCQVQEYMPTRDHQRSVYFHITETQGGSKLAIRYHNNPKAQTPPIVLMDVHSIPFAVPTIEEFAQFEALIERARNTGRFHNGLAPYLQIGTVIEFSTTVGA